MGFTNTHYGAGTQKSEELVEINPIGKVHSKCDCANGLTVIEIGEPMLFSFNLDKSPGYDSFKLPTIVLTKNKTTNGINHIEF